MLAHTLPLLTPFIYIAALLRFMDAFRSFDIVFVLTGGGPADRTLLRACTSTCRGCVLNMGYAAALSYDIVLIVLAAAYVFIRLEREH